MHTYKLRMLLDDQDDFLRDYEIRSNQTFLNLYELIRQTVKLQGNELASFFICDSKWRKKKEITLMDMQDETEADQGTDDDDDEYRKPQKKLPTFTMENAKIKDFIEDPAQRILLEYDFLNPTVFYLELFKISEANENVAYPICVKQTGELIQPNRFSDHSVPTLDDDEILTDPLEDDDEPDELIDDDLTSLGFNNDTKW
jgi:hypothetical protein